MISYIPLGMEEFRLFLKQEYMRRSSKNANYSLRAFAQHLKTNHATLSTILSGKRKLTKKSVEKMSVALGLSPRDVQKFTQAEALPPIGMSESHYFIENDIFSLISDWYYDAILELSQVRGITLNAKTIAQTLSISNLEATLALETLERLSLLKKDTKNKYVLTHKDSTNDLDPSLTSAAQKKYQMQILEKSLEAIHSVDRSERDHTSTTLAIQTKDLAEVKKLIKKFRYDLTKYVQRASAEPNDVYQLQVAFFPLTKNLRSKDQ